MLKFIDSFVWSIGIIMLVYSCLKLSFYLKFIQFRFKDIFINLNKYTYKSLLLSLGGKIGVGSIAGTSLAILIGGSGTIFWMVIIGFFTVPLLFSEVLLGLKYKEKVGGPAYYIKNGLNKNKLSIFYAFIMFVCIFIGSLSIQANTIVIMSLDLFNYDVILISFVVCLVTFFVIRDGLDKIIQYMNYVVPIMVIIYIISVVYILIVNCDLILFAFSDILNNAFNFNSVISGVILIGVQRGLFAYESGVGTASIMGSSINTKNIIGQSFVQCLSNYFISLVICLLTGLVIIISTINIDSSNGIEVVSKIFNLNFGIIGDYVLYIIIILFAFSSMVTAYYTAFCNYNLLFKKNIWILKYLVLLIIIFSSYVSSSFIWQVLNIFTGILVIINVYAVMKLKKDVKDELNMYDKSVKI